MHKLFKLKNLLIGIALLGLVLLPALGAFVAQAQTTPRGTDAPVGRVLQAATCNENDAVTVQVSPATPKIGGTVKFTGTVKSECQAKVGGTGNGGSMWLYHGEYTPSNTQFEAEIANGFTIAKEFPITPQLFSPGQHLVGVKMSYCAATFGEPLCLDFLGRITITVEAAATTGGATLTGTVAQQVQVSTIREVFTLVYNAGGSGKTAAKIEFYCGNENPPVKRTQNVGQPINCDYEKKAGTYTFTATALDASNNPIQGATFSKQITLTGNETNAVGVDTPGLGDLAFGGFELFIGWLLKLFSGALKYTILWIVGPFIEAVLSIHTYDDKFANVIYPAWEIFRNLGNIFFILSIVAIGVATVFRISGWAVKDLLVKLIVGAILINFSLSIAQSILGIADTVQNQFLPNDTGAIRQIVNHLFTTDIFSGTPGNLGGFNGILEQIMNFFLAFGSFIAFLGIAALLTVRILFLWILLMLSPLPYIAMVLPISRSMSKKWWSEFGKWAFITPVMAFMLNLTALITVQTKASNIIQSLSNTDPSKTDGVVSGVMFAFASNAIPLGFLYMTLKAATAFGSGASGFVNKAAEKGVRAAFWPAAAAGAALGAGAVGAGKYVGGAAAGLAGGVAKVPLNLVRNKFAENSMARSQRISKGEGTAVDKAKALLFDSNKILAAKNKRYEGYRKDYEERKGKAIAHTEENIISRKGGKVRKARRELKGKNLSETDLRAQEALLSSVDYEKLLKDNKLSKDDPELSKALEEKRAENAEALKKVRSELVLGSTDDFADYIKKSYDEQLKTLEKERDDAIVGNAPAQDIAAKRHAVTMKQQEKLATLTAVKDMDPGNVTVQEWQNKLARVNEFHSLDGKNQGAALASLAGFIQQANKAEIDPLLKKKNELQRLQTEQNIVSDLVKAEEDKAITEGKSPAEVEAIKNNQDAIRNGARVKAGTELKELTDLKGKSKYLAFYGEEELRHEYTDGQSSKLPKEYDEGNNINQFRSAVARGDKYLALKTWELAEKEGDIKKLLKALGYKDDPASYEQFLKDHFGANGFNMGEQTLTELRRESSKRNKAAGNFDLSEQVRYDANKGEYIDNDPIRDRLKTVVDKMMGDSSAQQTLNKLNTSSVFSNPGTGNAQVNDLFKTFLARMDLKDAGGLKAIAERMPTAVAKQIATVGKVLQSQEAVDNFRKDLMAYVQTADGGNLTKEEAKDFYLMIQKASQERLDNRDEIQEAYKRVNETYRTEQGYNAGRKDKVQANPSGQSGTNPSGATGAPKFEDNPDNYKNLG